jgi:hypothetical protein
VLSPTGNLLSSILTLSGFSLMNIAFTEALDMFLALVRALTLGLAQQVLDQVSKKVLLPLLRCSTATRVPHFPVL